MHVTTEDTVGAHRSACASARAPRPGQALCAVAVAVVVTLGLIVVTANDADAALPAGGLPTVAWITTGNAA